MILDSLSGAKAAGLSAGLNIGYVPRSRRRRTEANAMKKPIQTTTFVVTKSQKRSSTDEFSSFSL